MTDQDDKLSRRYRSLAREEPPAALDEAILAASRRAVAPRARNRWAVPASIAAVLVLGIGISLRMQLEQPGIETSVPSSEYPVPSSEYPVPESAEPPAVATAPAPSTAEPQSGRAAQASEPPPRSKLQSAPKRLDEAKPRVEERAAPSALQKPQVRAQPEAFRDAPARVPEPFTAQAPAALAVPSAPKPSADSVPAAPPPAAPPAVASSPMAAAAPPPHADMLERRAEGAAVQPRIGAMRSKSEAHPDSAARDAARPAKDAREVELDRIARLRAEARHEEADKALEEFRRRHPDYRIAPATWERVKPR